MKYINRQIARAGGVVVAGFVMALLAQGSFAGEHLARQQGFVPIAGEYIRR
ncbi:MAG: hypothetical protein IPG67_18360 [Acidobacteria bacterium]|nr:hypothetical protein [Acidobacteriota bacterium]